MWVQSALAPEGPGRVARAERPWERAGVTKSKPRRGDIERGFSMIVGPRRRSMPPLRGSFLTCPSSPGVHTPGYTTRPLRGHRFSTHNPDAHTPHALGLKSTRWLHYSAGGRTRVCCESSGDHGMLRGNLLEKVPAEAIGAAKYPWYAEISHFCPLPKRIYTKAE